MLAEYWRRVVQSGPGHWRYGVIAAIFVAAAALRLITIWEFRFGAPPVPRCPL